MDNVQFSIVMVMVMVAILFLWWNYENSKGYAIYVALANNDSVCSLCDKYYEDVSDLKKIKAGSTVLPAGYFNLTTRQ